MSYSPENRSSRRHEGITSMGNVSNDPKLSNPKFTGHTPTGTDTV